MNQDARSFEFEIFPMAKQLLLVSLVVVCFCQFAKATPSAEDTASSIVSTDLLNSQSMRISVFPYAYYSPEIQLAFGAGGIITFFTAGDSLLRPSKLSVSAYYSTSKQYSVGFSPQLYFLQNQVFTSMKLFLSDRRISPPTSTIPRSMP